VAAWFALRKRGWAMPDAAIHSTDLIIGRSLITAETVAQELRERLAADLAEAWYTYSYNEVLQRARQILYEFEPLIAKHLHATDLAAWIAGMDSVAKELPEWSLDVFGDVSQLPPGPPRNILPSLFGGDEPELRFPMLEQAAQRLRERNILTREEFDLVSERERARAFTVAGDLTEQSIERIRDTLARDIDRGTSLRGFQAALEEELEQDVLSPWHLETVYRTNVQGAFRDGYEDIMTQPVVSDLFPYQEYLAIGDGRVREEHLALETLGLNGTGVYRRDDPMWELFQPPWDFNCRCSVVPLTIDAAADRGVREAIRWRDTGEAPAVPEWRLDAIPFRPTSGFVGGRRTAGAI
jgi:SPP1 gp7 family putative phage head morphogenesis protein